MLLALLLKQKSQDLLADGPEPVAGGAHADIGEERSPVDDQKIGARFEGANRSSNTCTGG